MPRGGPAAAAAAAWCCVLAASCGALPLPAGAPVCPAPEDLCSYIGGGLDELQYKVRNNKLVLAVSDGKYLKVDCNGSSVLEMDELPRAPDELRVPRVYLVGCRLPRARSLADVLRALHVQLQDGALELRDLPPDEQLDARHLQDLRLHALSVSAPSGHRVHPAPGFLRPLPDLAALTLVGAVLPPAELDAPWLRLTYLKLRGAGAPPSLGALPALTRLVLQVEDELGAVELPPSLRSLELTSSNSTMPPGSTMGALESLTLVGWGDEWPEPVSRCDALQTLTVLRPAARKLPPGWLAACTRLQSLTLSSARALLELPADLVPRAGALTSLTISSCRSLKKLPDELLQYASNLTTLKLDHNRLRRLPSGLLDHAPALLELHLQSNRLKNLSSGIFIKARQVQVLDLSRNNLDSEAVKKLAPLDQLLELRLDFNPRLGDLCEYLSSSRLSHCVNLKKLYLRNTGVSHICNDWRTAMRGLQTLDLRGTNITELWDDELHFERNVSGAQVQLEDAPLSVVGMTTRYFHAAASSVRWPVRVDVRARLACNCYMYWMRLALQLGRVGSWVGELQCEGSRSLGAVPPSELVCHDEQCLAWDELPPQCACTWRHDVESDAPGARVNSVRCQGAVLPRLPAPAPSARTSPARYELQLANNTVQRLHADDFYDDIVGLDLRNTSLSVVDEATAAALGRVAGVLRLADNPLECSCRGRALLEAVLRRPANSSDVRDARCAGGARLAAALPECVPPAVWLAAGFALLAALALAALVALWSRERRFFVKAVLHRWGVTWPHAEPPEDSARPYDAFVTFAHEDETTVLEVVARLEPRYRLCVHYRDWVPGRLITEQIAESVERSRRTVALVSRHFLASTWARAEFREAHAAAMRDSAAHRLVVVLLEEPRALPLDAQLRRYIRTNTYVRWGDAWFWDKLQVSLPPPRAHPPLRDSPAPALPVQQSVSSPIRTATSADHSNPVRVSMSADDSDPKFVRVPISTNDSDPSLVRMPMTTDNSNLLLVRATTLTDDSDPSPVRVTISTDDSNPSLVRVPMTTDDSDLSLERATILTDDSDPSPVRVMDPNLSPARVSKLTDESDPPHLLVSMSTDDTDPSPVQFTISTNDLDSSPVRVSKWTDDLDPSYEPDSMSTDDSDPSPIRVMISTDGLNPSPVRASKLMDDSNLSPVRVPMSTDDSDPSPIRVTISTDDSDPSPIRVPMSTDDSDPSPVRVSMSTDDSDPSPVRVAISTDDSDPSPVRVPMSTDDSDPSTVRVPMSTDDSDPSPVRVPMSTDDSDPSPVRVAISTDDSDPSPVRVSMSTDDCESSSAQVSVWTDDSESLSSVCEGEVAHEWSRGVRACPSTACLHSNRLALAMTT